MLYLSMIFINRISILINKRSFQSGKCLIYKIRFGYGSIFKITLFVFICKVELKNYRFGFYFCS